MKLISILFVKNLLSDSYLHIEDFEKLYEDYYAMLCMIAYEYCRDKKLAEDLVSETFMNLWERRHSIVIQTSVKNYLIKSTQNTCLQHIRKRKIETSELNDDISNMHIAWGANYPLGNLFEKELEGMIQDAIENLPAKCREIFLLSRDEEMTYGQIAETLNISENTVKTQVKTALSRIRIALKDYLILGAIGIIKLFFG